MLAAHLMIVQVLDSFEVRCNITEFSPGMDPEHFSGGVLRVNLPDDMLQEDALTITKALIALWSEMTI